MSMDKALLDSGSQIHYQVYVVVKFCLLHLPMNSYRVTIQLLKERAKLKQVV